MSLETLIFSKIPPFFYVYLYFRFRFWYSAKGQMFFLFRFRFRPKVKNILSVIHCAIPTTSNANKTGRIEQLGRKPLNRASGAKDADIPINGQGKTAVMRQKIGTLNFPPLNQENGAKGVRDLPPCPTQRRQEQPRIASDCSARGHTGN